LNFFYFNSDVAKNFGVLRECVDCSKAYANFSALVHSTAAKNDSYRNQKQILQDMTLGPATAGMVDCPRK